MADSKLSPTALALMQRIDGILSAIKTPDSLFSDEVVSMLSALSPDELDKLKPPGNSIGYWTDDVGFTRRLAAYVFGVSPETVGELPGSYYVVLQALIAQNFLKFLGGAMRGTTRGSSACV